MESILARALEYTLKYWLKSFSRDQFKLHGHTAQLSNLDINGDALHASVGLPPALNVTTAKVGKLEITLPSVSNVQVEPIVVHIDRLDLVLEENAESDNVKNSSSAQSTQAKGSGYGFADKIADGMTLEVSTVNLMLETRGGARQQGDATWSPPLASITIRNLLLYTTNENWQVVNLKEARDFSNNKKFIYVFKKLEWESLSVDLLPHPDMFADERLTSSNKEENSRDDDGAKRLFFGGERFLEGISGQANITVQRTEQNSPLGLEVQLHITEAVCPALSEPGLRAFLRFMTGLYVCLNRGDVDPKAQQRCTEAAGRSLVSIIVDHIFLCIKDADFRLEFLMQSLFFCRASVSDGETTKTMSRIMVGGMFLRDTFSRPPCALVQPSMRAASKEFLDVPEFGQNFCPSIYPLGNQQVQSNVSVPLVCLHSLQINPSPAPPKFASQTVIDCQPLMITLQEESCLRIASFLADGIVVNRGALLPDFSVNSFVFTLKEFDVTVPLDAAKTADFSGNHCSQTSFSGARLHVEDLYFSQSPSIKCTLLNLDKDPSCFSLWEYQPIDASQKKWTTRASHLSLSLETRGGLTEKMSSADWATGLWRCVELHDACFEAAMVTADGNPLLDVPPPEGVVRIGVACQQYLSNTSVEQLFFVLNLYAYFGRVSEKISKVSKRNRRGKNGKSLGEKLVKRMPSDTAVSLAVKNLHLKFLESTSMDIQVMPLVQFGGQNLFLKVSHRTLGGAFAVSTNLQWEAVSISCLDEVGEVAYENGIGVPAEHCFLVTGNGCPQMRAVFWIDNGSNHEVKSVPFLDISTVHVMPFNVQDMESHSLNISAKIAGVRLGGGMNYTESLLHRFGILGPDGGPGEGLLKGLKNLSSGPLAKLFRASPFIKADLEENGCLKEEDHGRLLELEMPDDVDVSVELKNWLFALEGTQEMQEGWWLSNDDYITREERCWHTTFRCLQVKAKSNNVPNSSCSGKLCKKQNFPVELITAVPLYLSEMAPARLRGMLNIGFQLMITIGIFVANLVNYGTSKINGGWGWRVSLALAAVPAATIAIGSLLLPDTPSSLIDRGHSEKARAMLRRIRGTSDVDAEYDDLVSASEESKLIKHPWATLRERRYRPQVTMAILIPFFQQLTGMNIIMFYAPVLFKTIGFGADASLMSSVIIGLVNAFATLVSIFSVDRAGRRVLFIEGGIQMTVCQIIIGVLIGIKFGTSGVAVLSKGYAAAVVLFICFFVCGYAWSWGPLGWLVPSEIFPLEIRSAAQSITVAVNMLFTFVIAQIFLPLLCHMKFGLFFFFAGWELLMTIFIAMFLPETKNVPIEEMNTVWKKHWYWSKYVDEASKGSSVE